MGSSEEIQSSEEEVQWEIIKFLIALDFFVASVVARPFVS
jgi:hypothetical protein